MRKKKATKIKKSIYYIFCKSIENPMHDVAVKTVTTENYT